jgi:hypothetical protein
MLECDCLCHKFKRGRCGVVSCCERAGEITDPLDLTDEDRANIAEVEEVIRLGKEEEAKKIFDADNTRTDRQEEVG